MVFIRTDNHVKTSYLTTIIIHHFINQSLMRKDQMMNHHWWYFVKDWYWKMYSHSVPVKPELSNFFGGNWQLNIDLLESKHFFLSFLRLKKMSKNAQTSRSRFVCLKQIPSALAFDFESLGGLITKSFEWTILCWDYRGKVLDRAISLEFIFQMGPVSIKVPQRSASPSISCVK